MKTIINDNLNLYNSLSPYFIRKENKKSFFSFLVKKEIKENKISSPILDKNNLPAFLRGGEIENDIIFIEKEIITLRKEKKEEIALTLKRRIEKEESAYLSLSVKKVLSLNFSALL